MQIALSLIVSMPIYNKCAYGSRQPVNIKYIRRDKNEKYYDTGFTVCPSFLWV